MIFSFLFGTDALLLLLLCRLFCCNEPNLLSKRDSPSRLSVLSPNWKMVVGFLFRFIRRKRCQRIWVSFFFVFYSLRVPAYLTRKLMNHWQEWMLSVCSLMLYSLFNIKYLLYEITHLIWVRVYTNPGHQPSIAQLFNAWIDLCSFIIFGWECISFLRANFVISLKHSFFVTVFFLLRRKAVQFGKKIRAPLHCAIEWEHNNRKLNWL